MSEPILPLGKLPAEFMARMLALAPAQDDRVLVGPEPGLDCAVLDAGDTLFVLKSDPITFTAGDLGWYLVQINANDIVTTGATPRWLMATLLFPESKTSEALVQDTFIQLANACKAAGISLIGGHTEVTQGFNRPVAVGTMIGEVSRENLVTPRGASPGDTLMLTKSICIEAVAILCQEFGSRLKGVLSPAEFEQGLRYHLDPGISVIPDAKVALAAGPVSAMHDPTEGGLAAALWELSDASGRRLIVDIDSVPLSPIAGRICNEFHIDPMAAISSGALLLTAPKASFKTICLALREAGIPCAAFGQVEAGPPGVWFAAPSGEQPLLRPSRDEIARLFDRL